MRGTSSRLQLSPAHASGGGGQFGELARYIAMSLQFLPIYRELGVEGYHRNCSDNFHEALAELNIVLPFTPASLNLFMSVPVAPDGVVDRLPPKAKAGDAVILRAEMRLVLILSACPQDITPINGFIASRPIFTCVSDLRRARRGSVK